MLRRTLGEQVGASPHPSHPHCGTRKPNGIVNLAVNARDAMPKGGRIIIETRNAILDADQLTTDIDVKPGEYMRLSISDTGSGVSVKANRAQCRSSPHSSTLSRRSAPICLGLGAGVIALL